MHYSDSPYSEAETALVSLAADLGMLRLMMDESQSHLREVDQNEPSAGSAAGDDRFQSTFRVIDAIMRRLPAVGDRCEALFETLPFRPFHATPVKVNGQPFATYCEAAMRIERSVNAHRIAAFWDTRDGWSREDWDYFCSFLVDEFDPGSFRLIADGVCNELRAAFQRWVEARSLAEPPTAAATACKTRKKSINERMVEIYSTDRASLDWTSDEWANRLACDPSTVRKTDMWEELERERERFRQNSRPETDRRNRSVKN